MKWEVVLFDLGETLLNYGDVDANLLFLKGARLTYEYLEKQAAKGKKLEGFRSYHRRHILSIKLHYFWSNVVQREFDCLHLLEKKAQKMGFALRPEQVEELAWLWYEPLGRMAEIEEDLHESLEELQKMSLRLGIISNTFLPGICLDRHLLELDLLGYFPVRTYSSDSIYRKPDKRIYYRALEKLKVQAEHTVMVGDKLWEDIHGAQKLGIQTVFKRGALNQSRKVSDHIPVIKRISELPGLLRNWREKS